MDTTEIPAGCSLMGLVCVLSLALLLPACGPRSGRGEARERAYRANNFGVAIPKHEGEPPVTRYAHAPQVFHFAL